jgi:hypothetical protein
MIISSGVRGWLSGACRLAMGKKPGFGERSRERDGFPPENGWDTASQMMIEFRIQAKEAAMAWRLPASVSASHNAHFIEGGVQFIPRESGCNLCGASFPEVSVLNKGRSVAVRLEAFWADGSWLSGDWRRSASGIRDFTTSTL